MGRLVNGEMVQCWSVIDQWRVMQPSTRCQRRCLLRILR
jgi:hypothetical protein